METIPVGHSHLKHTMVFSPVHPPEMVQTVFITFIAPIAAIINQVTNLFPGNTFGVFANKVPAKESEISRKIDLINIVFTSLSHWSLDSSQYLTVHPPSREEGVANTRCWLPITV